MHNSQEYSLSLSFENNSLLPVLYGEYDKNLSRLEKSLHINVFSRGNTISLKGDEANVNIASNVLNYLYKRIERGKSIDGGEVEAAIRFAREKFGVNGGKESAGVDLLAGEMVIKTPRKHIAPHTKAQSAYMKLLTEKDMVFAIGPAGTGKTYVAVAMAVSMFMSRRVERIILCRPAVEAGEKLGFLPGDLREKIDPYLRPLYDAIYEMMPPERVVKCMETGEIEMAPLAFMRGRTLSNAYVILDEAQNCTPMQMKMFLTRIGEGSRMVIAGDLTQVDLPPNITSGLKDAVVKLEGITDIGFARFAEGDVLRHPLAGKIVTAYEREFRK